MSSDDTEGLVDQVVPGFLSSVQNPRVPLPPSVLLRRRPAGGRVMAGLTTAPRFLLVSEVSDDGDVRCFIYSQMAESTEEATMLKVINTCFIRQLKIHGSLLSLNTLAKHRKI